LEEAAMSDQPRALPTGTVTFLFTDIEGSTRLLADLGEAYDAVLATHTRLLRAAIEGHGGIVVNTEGDAVFAVFESVGSAVEATVAAQRALASEAWPNGAVIRVRMGLHTGEGRPGGEDYVGLDVNRAARVAAAGHGGQALLSGTTATLIAPSLPPGVELRDHGLHRLKDLPAPEHLWQLDIEGLVTEFPRLRTLEAPAAHLPAEITSFVGRAEVDAVTQLTADARLVTLTGPGGTGKTRLSQKVASEIADRFADGAYFVALDAVSDADLVASEIATTLSLTGGTGSPLDHVIGHLRERKVLLVLDNFEQVVDAAPDVAAILRECARVNIIATSRIPLRIRGEREFAVPALATPIPGEPLDPSRAGAFEGVQLFVERARDARPEFHLDAENAPIVGDIVTRLDGLPLAIELAAARLRTLSVQALRTRLDSRLGGLTGGARDVPERQRTLRAAIDWSHDLLDEPDRRLFSRFSVMAGGAVLDQVEATCGSADELGRDVFDGLEALSEQSLLRVETETGGDPRFAMLATIREYAGERLAASAEAELIRDRHARAFLLLAETAAPHLVGSDGARWNDRLEIEHDNLRAALDWIIERDEAALGLRMVAALWRFWQVRGHLYEGDERVHTVLAMPSAGEQPVALRARAESAAGGIAWWRSDFAATHRHYAAALELARATDDKGLLAEALYNAGFVPDPHETDSLQRYLGGKDLFEEGLALYRELDDDAGVASCLWALAFAAAGEDDIDRATELGRESLAISRGLGDPFRTGWAAHFVGMCLMVTGALDEAAQLFGESMDIWTAAGDKSGIVLLLSAIAMLADARGRPDRRWRLIGAVDRLRAETGTDLVNQDIELLGWRVSFEPESDEARAWLEAGRGLDMDDAVALAQEEVAVG
jgi:predicted ATPase/class 3 adenylate cyclase